MRRDSPGEDASRPQSGGRSRHHRADYPVAETGLAIFVTNERRGIAHATFEIRRDGLRDPADARIWAERLAAASRRAEQLLPWTTAGT